MTTFQEGSRVRLKQDIERFPHFFVPAGATGTVSCADDDATFWVRMDEHIEGAECWDNEIHFSPEYEEGSPEDWLDLMETER